MIIQSDLVAEGRPSVEDSLAGRRRPVVLRRIDREAMRYLNQIALQRPSLEFEWQSRRWSLQLSPLASSQLCFAELVSIDWGGSSLMLRVGKALLQTAMSNVLGLDDPGPVTGEIRAILVEAAFAGLANEIELRTRKRFRLLETTEGHDGELDTAGRFGFSVLLNDGDTEFACEAWIDELALGFLATASREWRVEPTPIACWSGLPLIFQVSAGWTTLRMGAIRRLSPHDVILLDECLVGGDDDLIMIRVGERYGVRGKLENSKITITDWLDEIMDETDDFDDFGEEDEQEPDRDAGAEDGGGLDQIPVRMNFDLGERVMTLAEVRALAPGYVLELGRDLRRAVAIRVNGRKIGEGELVEIDGYIGVSLLSINPPSV